MWRFERQRDIACRDVGVAPVRASGAACRFSPAIWPRSSGNAVSAPIRSPPVRIRTKLGGGLNDAFEAMLVGQTALRRVGEPNDVGSAISGLLGITQRVDYDGKDGPPGHPDLKGFGANNRIFLWLRPGIVAGAAAHVGFVANRRPRSMPPMPRPWRPARMTTGADLLRPPLLCRKRARSGRIQPRIRLQDLAALT